GIDRLLNAVAANCVRSKNQPALIVDSGTATTVDTVDQTGAFMGGSILPGFELSARALHHYTALLPLIPLDELNGPKKPIPVGTNTRAAMQSGLYWGQVGAVRELLARSCRSFGFENPLTLLTGGGGALLAAEFPEAQWFPHLSLQGLALVLEELFPSLP
ncbi:MAG: type III pantothenate kinase, partial [Planctomycetaceae bacterium]|nr:type III pantothenate kinase [Planctomycetaceae bacterium]